jgi:hypothetical protein
LQGAIHWRTEGYEDHRHRRLMKKLQVEIQGDGRVVDEALGAYA